MPNISITIATADGDPQTFSVDSSALISTISSTIHAATSIPAFAQSLTLDGRSLSPTATFADSGVASGDLIFVSHATPPRASPVAPAAATPLLTRIRANPNLEARLRSSNPALHAALSAGDPARAERLLSQHVSALQSASRPLDPMSADAQAHIAERIRQENVEHNFAEALEHNPESFGQVVMLFVDVKINGAPSTAFVDSGAQSTIISKQCATRCNILRLLDTRFAGIARGVGTAKIFGRIHMAMLEVSGVPFNVSLTVMEDQTYDMLLGLDMLRKHKGCIDLNENCLRIGDVTTPFLPEHRIPRGMRSISTPSDARGGAQAASIMVPPSTNSTDTSVAANSNRPSPAVAPHAPGVDDVTLRRKVDALVGLGFSAADAEQALRACGGNKEQAAAMLAQSKYGF